MRIETLLSPGVNSQSLNLRTAAAKAISHAELYSAASDKQSLTDFFYDCAVKGGGARVAAANQFVLTSGVKVNAVAVTGTGNFATPTIVNGVITGIVLSAS